MLADNFKERSDYIPISLFGKMAEHVLKYMQVGDHISIEGRVSTYRDNLNNERVTIIANRVNFEGYKNPKKSAINNNTSNEPINHQIQEENGFIPLEDREELGKQIAEVFKDEL